MEDESEDREQRLHDARMARKDAEAAVLAKLKSDNADLLAACEELRAFVGVMFGRGDDAVVPQHVASPLGPSIRLGDIMLQAANAIAKARTP